jgi:hypothetical protein
MSNERPHIQLRLLQLCDLLTNRNQLLFRELEYATAWNAAFVAGFEDVREFCQRESQLECSLHQRYTLNRLGVYIR